MHTQRVTETDVCIYGDDWEDKLNEKRKKLRKLLRRRTSRKVSAREGVEADWPKQKTLWLGMKGKAKAVKGTTSTLCVILRINVEMTYSLVQNFKRDTMTSSKSLCREFLKVGWNVVLLDMYSWSLSNWSMSSEAYCSTRRPRQSEKTSIKG